MANLEKIKHLEQELKVANEVSISLQKELDETNMKLSKAEEAAKLPTTKKKAPMLGTIGKFPSSDGVSVNINFFLQWKYIRRFVESIARISHSRRFSG